MTEEGEEGAKEGALSPLQGPSSAGRNVSGFGEARRTQTWQWERTLPQPAPLLRTWGLKLEMASDHPFGNWPQRSRVRARLWGTVNRKINGRREAQGERKGLGQRVSQNV